jgi:hypothetical protein
MAVDGEIYQRACNEKTGRHRYAYQVAPIKVPVPAMSGDVAMVVLEPSKHGFVHFW